jgi:hypothetical protein
MKNNKILKYVGYVVVIVAVFLLGISFSKISKAPETGQNVSQNSQIKTASLMIDYGNGQVKTYQDISISEKANAFDLLKSAADKNKITLGYKDYGGDMGVFIESIGGIGKDSSGKKWWQFWVNNKYSQVGVSSYKIHPGDVVEFKFIQGQE